MSHIHILKCDRCGATSDTTGPFPPFYVLDGKDLCPKCRPLADKLVEQFLNGQIHPLENVK